MFVKIFDFITNYFLIINKIYMLTIFASKIYLKKNFEFFKNILKEEIKEMIEDRGLGFWLISTWKV